MPNNIPHIKIPVNDWVNLYSLSNIAIGQILNIENVGSCDVYLSVQATKPPADHDAYNILKRDDDIRLSNTQGDKGAWAFCNAMGGLLSIASIQGFLPSLSIDSPLGLGKGITLDALGHQKVSRDFSLLHGVFNYDIPPSMWIIKENGVEVQNDASTKVTSIEGRLNVVSGATIGDTGRIESRRHPRFQPGRGLKWMAFMGFKGANLDGILKAGLIVNDETGIYLKTKGDGNLYACILSLGVETHEELINIPFTIDITLGNAYSIQLLGGVAFYAVNPTTGAMQLIHRISVINNLDEELMVANTAISAGFHAENITQQVSVWAAFIDVSAEGGDVERQQQYGSATSTRTVSGGDGVIAVLNPQLINGKINTRDLNLARIILSSDKKATIKGYITRDPAAIIGGAFIALGNGSFVEINSNMDSVNLLLMQEFTTFKIAAGAETSRDNPSDRTIDFVGVHGDYIVLVCDEGSIAEINATVEWGEEI